jgi:ribosomal protein S18 acetylase RimI-like enzyme
MEFVDSMVTIREAQSDDAYGIAKVYVEGWRSTYQGIVPDDHLANMTYEHLEQRWSRILNSDDGFLFVAEDEPENIVGFIWGGPEHQGAPGYTGELHAIYILQSYQGQDIGRKLTRALVRKMLEVGLDSMIVWVLRDNPSRHFYEKLGATLVRTAPYQVPDSDIVLDDTGYAWDDIHTLLN